MTYFLLLLRKLFITILQDKKTKLLRLSCLQVLISQDLFPTKDLIILFLFFQFFSECDDDNEYDDDN